MDEDQIVKVFYIPLTVDPKHWAIQVQERTVYVARMEKLRSVEHSGCVSVGYPFGHVLCGPGINAEAFHYATNKSRQDFDSAQAAFNWLTQVEGLQSQMERAIARLEEL